MTIRKESGKEGKLSRLPDAELDVMLVLWENPDPMKTTEISQALKEKKDWSMSTVQALLARLLERGFVTVKKKERLKYYSPLIGENVYRSQETKTFLERLHGNSWRNLLMTLVSNHEMNESDLDEIAEIIRRAGSKDD